MGFRYSMRKQNNIKEVGRSDVPPQPISRWKCLTVSLDDSKQRAELKQGLDAAANFKSKKRIRRRCKQAEYRDRHAHRQKCSRNGNCAATVARYNGSDIKLPRAILSCWPGEQIASFALRHKVLAMGSVQQIAGRRTMGARSSNHPNG